MDPRRRHHSLWIAWTSVELLISILCCITMVVLVVVVHTDTSLTSPGKNFVCGWILLALSSVCIVMSLPDFTWEALTFRGETQPHRSASNSGNKEIKQLLHRCRSYGTYVQIESDHDECHNKEYYCNSQCYNCIPFIRVGLCWCFSRVFQVLIAWHYHILRFGTNGNSGNDSYVDMPWTSDHVAPLLHFIMLVLTHIAVFLVWVGLIALLWCELRIMYLHQNTPGISVPTLACVSINILMMVLLDFVFALVLEPIDAYYLINQKQVTFWVYVQAWNLVALPSLYIACMTFQYHDCCSVLGNIFCFDLQFEG